MRLRRTMRGLWPLVLGFVVWGISACGLGSHPQASGRPRPHPLVAVTRTPPLITLKPTAIAVERLSGSQTRARMHANLTGLSQTDTLSLTMNPTGQSQLAITDAAGQTIWSKSSVDSVTILKFGRPHLPVILLQGGLNYCGSGGCQYQGYTWSPHRHHFITVGNPTSPAFRYEANTKTFRAIQASMANVDALFGFIAVQNHHLQLLERTYDLWQHAVIQSLHYAAGGTPGGRWVISGPAEYEPGGSEPNLLLTSPGAVWTAFLEARSLDLPLQGQPLIATGRQHRIWNAMAPLARLGESLTIDTLNPKTVVQGDHADVSVLVSGVIQGSSPDARMASYWVGAEVFSVAGTGVIEHASIDPIHLKVSSVYAVLRRIRRNVTFQRALHKNPKALVIVTPQGLTWEVALNQTPPMWSLDAKTGAIQSLGS